jgi:hypothetical protein
VERLPEREQKALVGRIAWLCALASKLDVPIIATEEESERNGTVVRDAVASPGESHHHGLERMRDAGAVVVGTRGLHYEWVRDVANASLVSQALSDVERPEDLLL